LPCRELEFCPRADGPGAIDYIRNESTKLWVSLGLAVKM